MKNDVITNSVTDDFTETLVPTDNELEWEESKVTQTALSKLAGRRRRVYGRRAHNSSTSIAGRSFGGHDEIDFDSNIDEAAKASREKANNGYGGRHKASSSNLELKNSRGLSSTENENSHPNLAASSSSSTPKKTFGSNTSTSLSCFSSISRNVSNTVSYGSYRSNSSSFSSSAIGVDTNNETNIPVECLTPTQAYSASSRKRGVCDSPLVGADDLSTNGGLSISRNSTSSFGSSRRSRSRIFSPASTHKMMEAAEFKAVDAVEGYIPNENLLRNKNEESFHESDSDDDNDENSLKSMMMNTTLDDSNSNDDMNHSRVDELPGFPAASILPPNRPRRMSSIDDAFAEAIFEPVEVASNHHSRIFKHMSSYEDLKFLIRELRKWKSGKQLVAFGMSKTCTVVPPKAWKHERKTSFIFWATTKLGFCQRSGGGIVTYIQTTQAKGIQILKDLEKALLSYKESCKMEETRPVIRQELEERRPPMSSVKILSRALSTPTLPSFRSSLTRRGPTPMSIDRSSPHCDLVSDLSTKLGHLNMHVENIDNTSSGTKIEAEISRIVTLPHDDNIISQGRPSFESAVMINSDLINPMHAITPRFNQEKDSLRFAGSLVPGSLGGRRSSLNDLCTFSPAVQLSLNYAGSETPMPQISKGRWDYQPIQGFDWGESEKCDDHVLKVLESKFEERKSFVGRLLSSNHVAPANLSAVSNEMRAVRASSITLGIDDEAESFCSRVEEDEYESLEEPNYLHDEDVPSFENFDIKEHMIPVKQQKRREKSFAKRNRMSICVSAMGSPRPFRLPSIHGKKSFANLDTSLRNFHTQLEPLRESVSIFCPPQPHVKSDQIQEALQMDSVLLRVFSFLTESQLMLNASTVCTKWSDVATDALANLMLISVGCSNSLTNEDEISGEALDCDSVDEPDNCVTTIANSVAKSMERSWNFLYYKFPWAMFLSQGSFKRVYKVWNASIGREEAVSVMDLNLIDDANIVGSELAVSVMLSSMARRNICPNFVLIRGVFTSRFEPSESHWGSSERKCPLGKSYDPNINYEIPIEPNENNGLFQYIRMELCEHGDVEEYIKSQPGRVLFAEDARNLLFQMAFSLHVAGDKFGLKHYDIKLLNFFLQNTNDQSVDETVHPYTVLRYGLGSHIFNLRTPTSRAVTAKLADFGTSNTLAESNGQTVMINNFTTLENTPPDYMILGDAATQGHGHDSFGLGLCMLHLFTGESPYEEILDSVRCPCNLKSKLAAIWESETTKGYEVIRSVILGEIYEDEYGNIEGEKDETLYDTFYRYLVLFGLPKEKFQVRNGSRVWKAVEFCLGTISSSSAPASKSRRSKRVISAEGSCSNGLDSDQFEKDQQMFSLERGTHTAIARARSILMSMEGGMDLLFSLISFDPSKRFSALDVMNSAFMAPLRDENNPLDENTIDKVYQYMSYLTRS
jgi:hypothetical protein